MLLDHDVAEAFPTEDMVSTSASTSKSLARTLRIKAVFSDVAPESPTATGGSFTGVTVIDTTAGRESARPSLTLKLNESLPLKSAAG